MLPPRQEDQLIQAASVLDRSRSALVVVDIQEKLAAVMDRRDQIIERTQLLVRAAAIVGVPIFMTRQYPAGLGPCSPEITEVLEEARRAGAEVFEADKMAFDCFVEPAFADAVKASGRTQLVIAGMETHICIVQTALTGRREGFEVHVAADACCAQRAEAHGIALQRLANAGAIVTTAESAAYELVGMAGTPEFKRLLGAVKGRPLEV
jgi:nicotinamidase-related amidase